MLEKTDFAYGAGLMRYHSLSIDGSATLVPLALLPRSRSWCSGWRAAWPRAIRARWSKRLTILGVTLALIGIVQKPLYEAGCWVSGQPQDAGSPFGPFVNKNHFAGWMVMAMPLSLGLLVSGLERAMRDVRPGWRHKVLWLSSPEANRLILLGAGALIMALSLVLTMSRSGISALALSIVLMGASIARGLNGRSRRAIGGAYLVVLLGATVAWVGVDLLAARFANTNWSEFNDRRGAWIDAVNVIGSFPLTGTG